MKTVPPLNDLFNMAVKLANLFKGDDKPEEVKSATSNKINTPTEEQK
jgi:hypothetical protein